MSFIGSTSGAGGPGYVDKTKNFLGQAAETFSKKDRVIKSKEPGKSVGGALTGIAGGAAAGGMVGGPWGAVIGGAVGLGGYLLS
jgi:hypothetical protein